MEDTVPAEHRPLYEVAADIRADWKDPPFNAVVYVDAMERLVGPGDHWQGERGDVIIQHFLGNAGTWHGKRAGQLQAELKAMLS